MHTKIIDIITSDACRFFNLDEDAVFHLKIEYGIKYLENRFSDDPDMCDALKHHAAFWLWWRQLWAERDRQLMKRCEHKYYGFNYSFPLNSYRGNVPMQETRRVFTDETWDFYEEFHYWHKVKLYPNEVMIKCCADPLLETLK